MTAGRKRQAGPTPRHNPTGNDGQTTPAAGQPDHAAANDRAAQAPATPDRTAVAPAETGGRAGPDPVRYGDWEKNGRCIDF